jgi:hypothetical protein
MWPFMRLDLIQRQGVSAVRTGQNGLKVMAASCMPVGQRRTSRTIDVRVTPVHDRHQDREEVLSFAGEIIFIAQWALLIGCLEQHACFGQTGKPFSDNGTRYAQPGLKDLEALHTHEAVPQDHQCPSVTENGDGAGDGASLDGEVFPLHGAAPFMLSASLRRVVISPDIKLTTYRALPNALSDYL